MEVPQRWDGGGARYWRVVQKGVGLGEESSKGGGRGIGTGGIGKGATLDDSAWKAFRQQTC